MYSQWVLEKTGDRQELVHQVPIVVDRRQRRSPVAAGTHPEFWCWRGRRFERPVRLPCLGTSARTEPFGIIEKRGTQLIEPIINGTLPSSAPAHVRPLVRPTNNAGQRGRAAGSMESRWNISFSLALEGSPG